VELRQQHPAKVLVNEFDYYIKTHTVAAGGGGGGAAAVPLAACYRKHSSM